MSRCLSVLCTGSLRCEGPVGGSRVVDGYLVKNNDEWDRVRAAESGVSGERFYRVARYISHLWDHARSRSRVAALVDL